MLPSQRGWLWIGLFAFAVFGYYCFSRSQPRVAVPFAACSCGFTERDQCRTARPPYFGGHLFVAVVSCRTAQCAERRKFLRAESWIARLRDAKGPASAASLIPHRVTYRFFVGAAAPKAAADAALSDEKREYSDIVEVPAPDDYRGLTEKTREIFRALYAAQFASHNSPPAPPTSPPAESSFAATTVTVAGPTPSEFDSPYDWFMKTDDDTYLQIDKLIAYLRAGDPEWNPRERHARVYSHFMRGMIVHRNPESRYVDLLFPTDRYPPFPIGAGYVLNRAALESLGGLATSPYAPVYANEDTTVGVWLTLTDVKIVSDRRFYHAPCAPDGFMRYLESPTPPPPRPRDAPRPPAPAVATADEPVVSQFERVSLFHRQITDGLQRCNNWCGCHKSE